MITEAPQTRSGSSRAEPAPRLLIGDDQPDVLEALRLLLKPEGYLIDTAASPQQLMRAMELKEILSNIDKAKLARGLAMIILALGAVVTLAYLIAVQAG